MDKGIGTALMEISKARAAGFDSVTVLISAHLLESVELFLVSSRGYLVYDVDPERRLSESSERLIEIYFG